jgi:hypothetical protein
MVGDWSRLSYFSGCTCPCGVCGGWASDNSCFSVGVTGNDLEVDVLLDSNFVAFTSTVHRLSLGYEHIQKDSINTLEVTSVFKT